MSKGIQVNVDAEENLDSEEAKSSSPVPIERTVEKISRSHQNLTNDESDHGKDSLKRRTTDGLVTKHPEMSNGKIYLLYVHMHSLHNNDLYLCWHRN